jgi:hypothetical protein
MISWESAFGFPSMVKATTLSIWFPLLLVDMFLVWLWWCLVMIDQSMRNIKRTDIQNDYTAERVSAMFFHVPRTGEVMCLHSLTAWYGELPAGRFSWDLTGNWKGREHAFPLPRNQLRLPSASLLPYHCSSVETWEFAICNTYEQRLLTWLSQITTSNCRLVDSRLTIDCMICMSAGFVNPSVVFTVYFLPLVWHRIIIENSTWTLCRQE